MSKRGELMDKLVQFKCRKGQKVRRKPEQFMVNETDALLWQDLGIGDIIVPLDPFDGLAEKIQEAKKPVEAEEKPKAKAKKKGGK